MNGVSSLLSPPINRVSRPVPSSAEAETVQKQISRYQETGIERERDAKNPCFAHDAKVETV